MMRMAGADQVVWVMTGVNALTGVEALEVEGDGEDIVNEQVGGITLESWLWVS